MKTKLASYDVTGVIDGLTVGKLMDMLSEFPRDAVLQTEEVQYAYEDASYLYLHVIGEKE